MKKRLGKRVLSSILVLVVAFSMLLGTTVYAAEGEDLEAPQGVSEDKLIEVHEENGEEQVTETDSEPAPEPAPNPDPNNQPGTSEGVEKKWTIEKEGNVIKIYYDIGEDVDGDVVINFSEVLDILNKEYQEATGDKFGLYPFEPSDLNKVDIEITTSNGHTYRYKDGSFRLETSNTTGEGTLTDFVGFDGQKIPVEKLGAIARSRPILKLYDAFSPREVKLNDLLNLSQKLEEAGYTGESALTDYMLDYYNNLYSYEYESFTDLTQEHPEVMVDVQGSYADCQFDITKEQYEEICKKYPDTFGKYHIVEELSNGKMRVQMKWSEEELAAASYDLFYKELFSFAFGSKEDQENFANMRDKWHEADLGVKDYMEDTNGAWSKVNEYLKEATAAGLNKDEATKLAISMAFGIDGPWTTNSYQYYLYSWYNSIEMEQVDGDITINKVDDNGNVITDPAKFQLYYYKMEVIDDKEETVTYYYAVDDDGNGYFTADSSKAALLITENGTCTVKYLLPDYQYYLKEVEAPNGYEVGQNIAISVTSKENTIINVTNKLIEIKPDPKPDPKPNPKPDPKPGPDTNPEEPEQKPSEPVNELNTPRTGNSNIIMVYIFAGLMSGAMAIITFMASKRKPEKFKR